MKHPFPLTHVGDGELFRQNEAIWQQRRRSTAQGLAHLAEIDARRLYLPAAYDSMQSFCIHELRFTADEAEKHIAAARVAQQYPVIFRMIAEGQLHIETKEPLSGDQLGLAANDSPAPERVLETMPEESAHRHDDPSVARGRLRPLSPGRLTPTVRRRALRPLHPTAM